VTLKNISRHALRILKVVLRAFYEMNGGKCTFFFISFVKRIRKYVPVDVCLMHNVKWS